MTTHADIQENKRANKNQPGFNGKITAVAFLFSCVLFLYSIASIALSLDQSGNTLNDLLNDFTLEAQMVLDLEGTGQPSDLPRDCRWSWSVCWANWLATTSQ
jgi:hypothetical protein